MSERRRRADPRLIRRVWLRPNSENTPEPDLPLSCGVAGQKLETNRILTLEPRSGWDSRIRSPLADWTRSQID